MSRRELLLLKVDLNFKVSGYHQTSRAVFGSFKSLFVIGTLTSIEDLFLTWSMKVMKMHIKLNLYSSICRATELNGVSL